MSAPAVGSWSAAVARLFCRLLGGLASGAGQLARGRRRGGSGDRGRAVHQVRCRLISLRQWLDTEQLAHGRDDGGVVEGRKPGRAGTDDAGSRHAGRDDHGGHPDAKIAEIEFSRGLAVWRDRRRRYHVVIAAAVLVVGDHQQGLLPGWSAADSIVNRRDQLLAVRHVVRRMFVVWYVAAKQLREIARLDEAVGGEGSGGGGLDEISPEVQEVRREHIAPDLRQGHGLRHVVKVDAPFLVCVREAVEDCVHFVGEARRRIVEVAVGRAGMDKEAVGPGLTGGGGVPAVGDAEGPRQLADDWHLVGGEIVHDRVGISRRCRRRLAHVVIDEAAHNGAAGVGRPVCRQAVDLHVDIVERLAGIRIGDADGLGVQHRGFADRDVLMRSIRLVPGVGLGPGDAVEFVVALVEHAEHAVERAVFQHENDDMFDVHCLPLPRHVQFSGRCLPRTNPKIHPGGQYAAGADVAPVILIIKWRSILRINWRDPRLTWEGGPVPRLDAAGPNMGHGGRPLCRPSIVLSAFPSATRDSGRFEGWPLIGPLADRFRRPIRSSTLRCRPAARIPDVGAGLRQIAIKEPRHLMFKMTG
jgi:hypothetical protein